MPSRSVVTSCALNDLSLDGRSGRHRVRLIAKRSARQRATACDSARSAYPSVSMLHLKRSALAVTGGVILSVCALARLPAQDSAVVHARRSSESPVARTGSVRVAPDDDIGPVRRQPKDLLDGIGLSRSQRKAVNGIVRRNARKLVALEKRAEATKNQPDLHAQLEREIADVRDHERAELRAVLSEKQRMQFDRNIVRLRERTR